MCASATRKSRAIVVGPVIDEAAYRRILDYLEIGKSEATLAYQAKDVPPHGYFIPPTIFTGVTPDMRIAREEIFGPVLSVIKVRDLDEAIDVANSTDYALTGGFFSRSPANIERVKAQLEAGNVYINRPCTGAIVGRHPFGGFKMSGGGTKAGGEDYLLNFLVPRVVTENIAAGTGWLRKKRRNIATNFSSQSNNARRRAAGRCRELLLINGTALAQQFHHCDNHVEHWPGRGQNNQCKDRHFLGPFPSRFDTDIRVPNYKNF